VTLVIAGTFVIDPARYDDAVAVMTAMAEASQAEAGCVAYRFTRDPSDPTRWSIFEEWIDDAALAAHFATEHMATFITDAAGIAVGAPVITRYEVASSGPLG
jgi:quinol monooxygenase YgiN